VIFNNGAEHVAQAEKFLLWLTARPRQRTSRFKTGNLPIRKSVADSAGFNQAMDSSLPGVSHLHRQPEQRAPGPAAARQLPQDLPRHSAP